MYTVKMVKVKRNFSDKTHNRKINAMPCQDKFFSVNFDCIRTKIGVQNILECHPLGSLMPRIESGSYINRPRLIASDGQETDW